MTTRNVSLTDRLDSYVEDRVQSGAFQNASEVVRDALRLHKARTDEEARKEERFRRLIQEGDDDIAAGRSEVIELEQLDDWLDRLVAEVNETADAAR
ncbi:MAG TPA: type II toxin-antitoxin system ParD family antitoxin [Caulobacteraceae bacterium]|jgi:antitoxin ParD1/3/4|nr:type II toxin-antitoxin system ParD family antitoxin [Caulobacteraceae bacterium]